MKRVKRVIRKIVIALVILAILGGGTAWLLREEAEEVVSFQTAQVTRGNIVVSIAATGTLEPEEVVDVGAQISGRIISFGKNKAGKTADYGTIVEQDTVIAKIDDALYLADEAEAAARVLSAKAGVQLAKANLEQLKAKLLQAQRDWERAKRLGPSEALAKSSYDAYEAGYVVAKANVAVGEATILQSEATLTQEEKSLWRAQRNLEYCTIKSPVTGMIIDRRVSIGQTVTAGMNTPSLFLIARDLRRMQVWVSVNEADIAKVYPGQPVTFTIDAMPDETFTGKVWKIRPNASMTQNVVTFTVEIFTDNSSGKLMPYLTANVSFVVATKKDVLLVPNAALRLNPTEEQVSPEYRQEAAAEAQTAENGNNTPTSAPTSKPADTDKKETEKHAFVWVTDGKYVKPIEVTVGLTDGINTEVSGEGLVEYMHVVTNMEASSAQSGNVNPFMPKMPRMPRGRHRPPM